MVEKVLPDVVSPLAPITPMVEKEVVSPVNDKINMQMVVSNAAAMTGSVGHLPLWLPK
jgi:hypothetical protein